MLCSRDKVPGGVRGDMSTKLATLACVGVLAAACASPKVQPAADTGLAADTGIKLPIINVSRLGGNTYQANVVDHTIAGAKVAASALTRNERSCSATSNRHLRELCIHAPSRFSALNTAIPHY
jgi:hypothetical protein